VSRAPCFLSILTPQELVIAHLLRASSHNGPSTIATPWPEMCKVRTPISEMPGQFRRRPVARAPTALHGSLESRSRPPIFSLSGGVEPIRKNFDKVVHRSRWFRLLPPNQKQFESPFEPAILPSPLPEPILGLSLVRALNDFSQ